MRRDATRAGGREVPRLPLAAYLALSLLAALVAVTAVAMCDACGAGGDRFLRLGGIVSFVLALAVGLLLAATSSRPATLATFTTQVAVLCGAYASAGRGAGGVRMSFWLYLVPFAAAVAGALALGQGFHAERVDAEEQ